MSVFDDIRTTLETAIDAMTTPTYNYNYDNVNEYRPANKTYPNVQLEFPEELGRDPDGEVIDAFSTDVNVSFKVMVDDTTADTVTALQNVLEDFKRLMEAEHASLQTDGMIVGDFIESTTQFTHVRARPGMITIIFKIFYRVRRSNPALTT